MRWWVIEAPGPSYLGAQKLGSDRFFWTKDEAKGLRFCREADANGAMMALRELNPDLFAFAATLGDAKAAMYSMDHGPA